LSELKKHIKDAYNSKYWTSRTPSDLLIHEFAHCLQYQDYNKLPELSQIRKESAGSLPFISTYASEKLIEYTAETFVKFYHDERLDKISLSIMRKLLDF